jgi:hypothetical protein
MQIDWAIVWDVAKVVMAALLGAFARDFFERRPRLITYYSHVSTHRLNLPGQPQGTIHTHSVVIRNTGRAPAKNVRVPHNMPMAHVAVWPSLFYTTTQLPGGGEELVFDLVVPKQEITISYLYLPPLQAGQINTQIRSDDGLSKFVPMNLTPALKGLRKYLIFSLFFLGIFAALYILAVAAIAISKAAASA